MNIISLYLCNNLQLIDFLCLVSIEQTLLRWGLCKWHKMLIILVLSLSLFLGIQAWRYHHHHQPINAPTAGAQAFLMDYTLGERAITHPAGPVQVGVC
jgi:hypothetical protein